ncbi:hypothetical protein ACKC6H_002712 [Acinetobacter baumannii]
MTANKVESKLTNVIRDLCIDNLDKTAIWGKVAEYYKERDEILNWDDLSLEGRNHHLQIFIREKILYQGKTPCNTDELVNLYTYMYTLMHVDAFRVAKRKTDNYTFNDIYNDMYEEVLLVDFGCGPGTIPLALAESYKSLSGLNINYIGIDKQPLMLNLAKKFLESPLFTKSLHVSIDRDVIRADNGIEPKKIIFVFSYLFSQPEINKHLESFVQRIKSIMNIHSTADNFYLMYINKDFTGELYMENGMPKRAWAKFLDLLRSNDMVTDTLTNHIKGHDYSFRKFNNLDGNNIDKFSGSNRPVFTKLFRLYKS